MIALMQRYHRERMRINLASLFFTSSPSLGTKNIHIVFPCINPFIHLRGCSTSGSGPSGTSRLVGTPAAYRDISHSVFPERGERWGSDFPRAQSSSTGRRAQPRRPGDLTHYWQGKRGDMTAVRGSPQGFWRILRREWIARQRGTRLLW